MASRRGAGAGAGAGLSPTTLLLLASVVAGITFLFLSSPPSSRPLSHAPVPAFDKQSPSHATPSTPASAAFTKRIVSVGDIHGDLAHFSRLLRALGLLNLKSEWVGGDSILVQTGDIVDRGRDTIAIYRLMDALRTQAQRPGGGVVSLLGNHELMNAFGDWRYVTKEDIATFGGAAQRREAMGEGWIGQTWRANYSITARVPFTAGFASLPLSLTPSLPPRATASPQVYFGDSIRPTSLDNPFSHAAISYVHGGILPEYIKSLKSDSPIKEINRIGNELLYSVINPSSTRSLPPNSSAEQREFWSERGPMWDRTYALDEDEEAVCARATEACDLLGVRHLVMGHTPHFEGPVARCDGKILLIDTGISRAYGGAISAVEFLFTLSPSSASSPSDDDDDPDAWRDPKHELRERSSPSPSSTRWIETEVVSAWFVGEKYPRKEVLVEGRREVELPLV